MIWCLTGSPLAMTCPQLTSPTCLPVTWLWVPLSRYLILNELVSKIKTSGLKRKTNDYVVCSHGAILHELDAQQGHTSEGWVIQLVSQQVEYDTIHYTHLVFHLGDGFNHFWLSNIPNWSFLWFWQSIPHGQRSIRHAQKDTKWTCDMPLHPT